MKRSLFILVAAMAMTASAQASVLARYQYSVGFARVPTKIELTVDSTGQVTYVKKTYNRPSNTWNEETVNVAVLSKTIVRGLQVTIAKIDKNDLVLPPPGQGCSDAPMSSYQAIDAQGEELVLEAQASCKTTANKGENAVAVKEALDGLLALVKVRFQR